MRLWRPTAAPQGRRRGSPRSARKPSTDVCAFSWSCPQAMPAAGSATRSSTSSTGCRHRRRRTGTSAFSSARSKACGKRRFSSPRKGREITTRIPSIWTGVRDETGSRPSRGSSPRMSTATFARFRIAGRAPSSDSRRVAMEPLRSRFTTWRASVWSSRGAATSIPPIQAEGRRSTSARPGATVARICTTPSSACDMPSASTRRSSGFTSAAAMPVSGRRIWRFTGSSPRPGFRTSSSCTQAHTGSASGARTPVPGSGWRLRISLLPRGPTRRPAWRGSSRSRKALPAASC